MEGAAVTAPNQHAAVARQPRLDRPEGPLGTSHDRQVVVKVTDDWRGPKDRQHELYRPFGPLARVGDCYPDLTVGAITSRRIAPFRFCVNSPAKLRTLTQPLPKGEEQQQVVLPPAVCRLPSAVCLLPSAFRLLPPAFCSPLTARCSPL